MELDTPMAHNYSDFNAELWKDVVGYEGLFQVSNYGRIKRVGRLDGKMRFSGEIRKPQKHKDGYLQVDLQRSSHRLIHRLVAESFLGVHDDLEVNHKDGDRTNNHLSNLEFVTSEQNRIHSYTVLGALNKKARGEQQHLSKLTDDKVRQIRKMKQEGYTNEQLAKIFNVRHTTISAAYRGATWKHVK